jgi:hypothetical protein
MAAERGPGGKFLPKGQKSLQQKVEGADTQTVLTAVKDVKAEDIVQDIGALQLETQQKLGQLSTALTTKIAVLRNVESAIGIKQARLQELHEIEAEAISLDELRAKEDQVQEEHAKARIARDQQWREEEEQHQKEQQRQEDEHNYQRALAEKKARDMFQAEMDSTRRQELMRKQDLEKSWADREAALKLREAEFAEAKAAIQTFPEKIKSEVSKAEAILGNTLKRDYTHATALLQKDMDAERSLNASRITFLENQLKAKDAQIADIQTQLSAARADARSVAEKALEAASGKEVTKALQQAMETQQPQASGPRR